MGNVLQAGQGQAPARQASLGAGDSGHRSLRHRPQGLRLGNARGHGRLQRDPGGRVRARRGRRHGVDVERAVPARPRPARATGWATRSSIDSMIKDGLWDPYKDTHMGNCAELCVAQVPLHPRGAGRLRAGVLPPRPGRDQPRPVRRRRSWRSRSRARRASRRRSRRTRSPSRRRSTRCATLKPAFQKDGSVTAANSSKINDGAAALVVASEERAREKGHKPIARIVALGRRRAGARVVHDGARRRDPEAARRRRASRSRTSISGRSTRPSRRSRWRRSGSSSLDPARVNVRGGAVALGPPDRRLRRPDPDDAHPRPAARGKEARHRRHLHRRRRGHGDAGRGRLSVAANPA